MKDKVSTKIGFWGAVALVFSGMVGSGILILPSQMAEYGTWGLASWIIGACMTYCIFLSFAQVSNVFKKYSKVDNPDILDFLRLKYCDNTSFLIAFGHFSAATISAAVTAMALGKYFIEFNGGKCFLCYKSVGAIALIVMFLINLISFSLANALNFGLTFIKCFFFLLISIWGSFWFPEYTPDFGAISLMFFGAGATMFAFAGIEFAIFSSGSIQDPEKNVIPATRLGLILSAIVFIGVSAATMFTLPDLSVETKAPVYDAAVCLMGALGAKLFGIISILSCLTTLNGVFVMQGNSLRNFAKKKYLFGMYDHETSQGFPWRGACTSLIISLLLIFSPYQVNPNFAVAFFAVLYSSVVILNVWLNGFSIVGLMGLISCMIMFSNINIATLLFMCAAYGLGFVLKSINSCQCGVKR